jgi:hypothetical protein
MTMSQTNTADRTLTLFMLVKTSLEWLGLPVAKRLEEGGRYFQPLLEEFKGKVRFKWYDTEFYNARVTDVWVLEAEDHLSHQMFCEKLRETPFWDHYFHVVEILPGELNAWAKNYDVAPLQS